MVCYNGGSMSDQTLPGAVIGDGGDSSHLAQSANQANTTKHHGLAGGRFTTIRSLLLIGGVLVLAFGIGWLITRSPKPPVKKPAASSAPAVNYTQPATVGVQVTNLETQGKTTEAEQTLNSKIASATNNTQKGSLYELLADAYLTQNDYSSALKAAQTAEKLAPNADTAQLIAESEAGLGDKAVAIQYYQEAANRYKNNGDLSSMQDMQAAIQGLN
jgi:tetratricopeptide (TPR) repeat protein